MWGPGREAERLPPPRRHGRVRRSRGTRPLIPLTAVTAPTDQRATRLVLGRAGMQRWPSEKPAPTRPVPGQLQSHRPGAGDTRDGDPRKEESRLALRVSPGQGSGLATLPDAADGLRCRERGRARASPPLPRVGTRRLWPRRPPRRGPGPHTRTGVGELRACGKSCWDPAAGVPGVHAAPAFCGHVRFR